MHTHSFCSDGDDFPEMVAEWYKRRGYNFIVFSPHNACMRGGDKWLNVRTRPGVAASLPAYRRRFGDTWVQQRLWEGRPQVRVKPLAEFRSRLEEPSRFLCVAGEEITDEARAYGLPVHLNVMNLQQTILPQMGATVRETLRRNVEATQRARQAQKGQSLLVQLNHPNYGWAIRPEEIADTPGIRFFEVFNGHPDVHNRGDATHPSTDRIWDIALTRRLANGNREPLYGIAVDDAHKFHEVKGRGAQPGRGWVMVQAKYLTPNSLIAAMERGQFYSSTGVDLEKVDWDGRRLSLNIRPEAGVSYRTRFIGTRRAASVPEASRIGVVLAEVAGTAPSYTPRGDEWYVRAKVYSSKRSPDAVARPRFKSAWTQPIFPK